MKEISKETLMRLPAYHRFLVREQKKGVTHISSTVIAKKFGTSGVAVRKDFASVVTVPGKPKLGFLITDLIKDIERFLGYDDASKAILVGVGQLGKALLSYEGFNNYGLNIVAAFDIKEKKNLFSCPIYHISKLPQIVKEEKVHIGIIAVPAREAQQVADTMVGAGIRGIWNFAPIYLDIPNSVAVKNEDMAASLAVLSKKIDTILEKERTN